MRAGWYSILATVALQAALAPLAAPLQAQESAAPWRLSYFPYLTLSPNDGVMGIARAIWFRQAEWGDRVTLNNSVAVEAGYSTKGSWLGRVTWANPRLADGWRVMAHGEANHAANFGPRTDQLDDDYLLERDRQVAWLDVTRRITGPLHVAVRPSAQHQVIAIASGLSDFEESETDLSVRGALVLDLRDREYEVNNGVLLELGAITGTAGDSPSYTAPYAHLRGWVRPWFPLRLTARYAWRGEADGLAPSYEFPGWEAPFGMLGGHRSHRGYALGERSVEDEVQLAGVEARFDVLNLGELAAVTVFGFVDGSRVEHHDESLTLASTTSTSAGFYEWNWAPGGGIAIRALRAATLSVSAARFQGRTVWYIGSGWSW
jgi:outer membrane protein assembly factor BamA